MRIALVRWMDAVTEEAADAGPAKAQAAILTEIGYLLDENDEAICIGMENHTDTGDIKPGRFRLHIPRRNVLEFRVTDIGKAFPKKTIAWMAGH